MSVYKIARFAGTSLNQIQKHYDHVKDHQISKEILDNRFTFKGDDEVDVLPPMDEWLKMINKG